MHNRNTTGVEGGFQNFLFPFHNFHSEFHIEFRQETLSPFSVLVLRFRSWPRSLNTFMPIPAHTHHGETKGANQGMIIQRQSYLFFLSSNQWKRSSWQPKAIKAAAFLLHPPPLVDPRGISSMIPLTHLQVGQVPWCHWPTSPLPSNRETGMSYGTNLCGNRHSMTTKWLQTLDKK